MYIIHTYTSTVFTHVTIMLQVHVISVALYPSVNHEGREITTEVRSLHGFASVIIVDIHTCRCIPGTEEISSFGTVLEFYTQKLAGTSKTYHEKNSCYLQKNDQNSNTQLANANTMQYLTRMMANLGAANAHRTRLLTPSSSEIQQLHMCK